MKRPDFFIVGAFKAGTTALYEYLRQHPQVFMPFHKEPMYFGADLGVRYRRMSEAEYLALFEPARPDQRVGEASPWYLYSTTAAREIRDFNPAAQIIVMLRNPVDVMHAQHGQLRFNRREDLADFQAALEAEPDRKVGRRIPRNALRVEALLYRESVRFAEQLERYLDVFGRACVHLVVHDDLAADTPSVYRGVLEFLGVEPSFRPDFSQRNRQRTTRLGLAQRLAFEPPRPLRPLVPALRRSPLVHRVRDALVSLDSREEARSEMEPELRQRLTDEFAPEVERLSALVGRDLSHWSRP